ncbi:type VI secretion system-associated FHA domain protein TagH [Paraburkholderia rhizosphaerae]|uniref:FHA domain protein n=1 Tax=Paraburkholderia rhizosphaerae TaxID=480658 RepID=A0A4R8LZ63_9BURK|nr:type VI secretion system-associated FHA domain protein TagH [Paraburkholderia rhizosphaerae]TDY52769.1 FHA domain protein [Paraburkholderia rhizosphaerae]
MSAIPSLTLTINGPSARRSVAVDAQGATLGRGADCTVVLADGRRAISRVQARIEWRGDRYVLIDTGGHPTLVNGNAPDASREVILRDGDMLSIGAYLIELDLDHAGLSAPLEPEPGAATVSAPLPGTMQAGHHVPPPTRRSHIFPPVADEPFFAMPAAALTALRGYAPHDDAATRVAQASPPAASTIEPVSASADERATVVHQREPASSDTVLGALLDGLGVEPNRIGDRSPVELARLAGSLLRDALQGTMHALRARTSTQQQTPVPTTMIDTHGNNPLKFFPDAEAALAQMLCNDGGAWLEPRAAVRQAFKELRDHELALVAGLCATLADVLSGLAPEEIEARLRPRGRIEAALSSRHARLWEVYVDAWRQTRQRVGPEFQRAFREPFARAYQAQLDALAEKADTAG